MPLFLEQSTLSMKYKVKVGRFRAQFVIYFGSVHPPSLPVQRVFHVKYSPGSAKLTYETQFKAQAQTQFNLSCNSA